MANVGRKLGVNIFTLMQNSGISREELAEKLDISWRHLQRLEHNESNTTVKTLKKLIKVLKISDKDILDYLKNDTGFYEDKD